MNKMLGVALIILGFFALAWGGFTYKTREKVLDIGPIEAARLSAGARKEHGFRTRQHLGPSRGRRPARAGDRRRAAVAGARDVGSGAARTVRTAVAENWRPARVGFNDRADDWAVRR